MNLRTRWTIGALLLACAGAADAQVYKWKDAKGVTHFSDTPPPAATAKVELKSFGGGAAAAALPFELAEAAKNHPVTLYTTEQCEACDQGRAMLRARGIPFAEKTVGSAADQAALKQAGGASQLPLLLVGRKKYTGFEQGAWDGALSAAAYPAQRMLPAGYRQAPATPAAPRPQPVDTEATAAAAAEQGRRDQAQEAKPAGDFQF
ncbi:MULTISPECIES: glutaredoxin family protein [unclassified Janthinobacterium]|uniref:glutaredoxin family protein n=1 Tax=unclassified Janthinobacterium TaxID=2610881 RepID=UPI00034BA11F|nr:MULTISPECIES: glutaredoxin family protein [unclassified Janthinobacterium]MEC5162742.1 glutaredoxin [Janthinobacterium sp. CG_S6]